MNRRIVGRQNASCGFRSPGFKNPQQFVEKLDLSLYNLLSGSLDSKPFCPIHLREFLLLARLGRPLHREGITLDLLRIQVSLKSPGMNQLTAWLPDCAKSDELARRQKTRLFLKLASGRFQRIFILAEFSFGHRP